MRGLAIAAVLAYHAGLPWARSGFLGVDAFFVLSGYLITSLLLNEWRATGSINLGGFWARRARRLLPALFLLLAGVACYGVVFAQPDELESLRGDALATLAYVANWHAIFSGESYFQQFSVPSPLQHTWSLAIEEQWYAVWPVLMTVLLRIRRASLGTLLGVALVLAAGSSLLMGWLYNPRGDPSRIYYGTDTRAQSLLVGAVLATWLARNRPTALASRSQPVLQLAALACGGYISWMWITTSYDSAFIYRGGLFLLALAVAVVIAAAVHPKRGPVAAILSCPPLRGLGLISYGVYLWHWPVYLMLTPERIGLGGYGLFAMRVLLTLVIATASYRLVELPFRRGAFRTSRVSWAMAPAAAGVLVIALLLVTHSGRQPLSASISTSPPTPAMQTELSENGPAVAPPVRVLVVGDSVAFTMAQGLERASSASNLSVWNQGRLGCGVLRGDAIVFQRARTELGDCSDWPARWQSYVDVFRPDVVIVLAGAWDLYDREVGGRVLEFGTPEADAFALSELEQAVDVLTSRGAKVMLLTTPYYKSRDLAVAEVGPRFDPTRIDRLNSLYEKLAQRHEGVVSVFDLNGFVRSRMGDNSGMESREISPDGVHFTPRGADLIAEGLAPSIRQLAFQEGSSPFAPTPSRGQGGEEQLPSRWLELLGQVPDTSDTRSWIVMNDYARYRQAFHIATPATDADEAARFDYYKRLLFNDEGKAMALAPAKLMGITDFPPHLAETRAQLGFSIADVDQDLWAGEYPVQVLHGRFAKNQIDAAVRANGGSGVEGSRVSSALGQDYVLAQANYLYASATPEDLAAMVDAAAGRRPSLADVPDFRLLAQGLDHLGTYTALFSVDRESYSVDAMAKGIAGPDASVEGLEAAREGLQRETKLLPYEAFATGAGVDARGPYTALVLINADEATARENVRRLQGRVDEGTSWLAGEPYRQFIGGVDISRDGRLVLAKLYSDAYRLWFALEAAKDTLLLHE